MRIAVAAVALLLVLSAAPATATALERRDVWFTNHGETPDMLDLFRHPEAWARARSQIGVFKFLPPNLAAKGGRPVRNSYAALRAVDAFARLRSWGIRIAAEEGAIKPWDCTGIKAATVTANQIASVAAAGGALQLVAMDSPWLSGRDHCALTLGETARRTAAYAAAVRNSEQASKVGVAPEIGDIEPYPSMSAATLIEWTSALEANGFKPAFVHLDINLHFVDLHPAVRMADDLRTLAHYFHAQGIPLGVIFWSGYGPLNSDEAYYDHVIDLARRIKAAIGAPDQAIFQSWVLRSSTACSRADASCAKVPCTAADPPFCGERSMPLNLPERGPGAFTQTRLVSDVLAILNSNASGQ